jgi:hypothetical protein
MGCREALPQEPLDMAIRVRVDHCNGNGLDAVEFREISRIGNAEAICTSHECNRPIGERVIQ